MRFKSFPSFKEFHMRRAMVLVGGVFLSVVSGCGENSPAAPVDNIQKNVNTKQEIKSDLKDIAKQHKDAADAANPLNRKK
jgi:hypothetical protein